LDSFPTAAANAFNLDAVDPPPDPPAVVDVLLEPEPVDPVDEPLLVVVVFPEVPVVPPDPLLPQAASETAASNPARAAMARERTDMFMLQLPRSGLLRDQPRRWECTTTRT